MSVQTQLTGDSIKTPYRSIVKDAYDTRDERTGKSTTLEIVAWKVAEHTQELEIKDPDSGQLRYNDILDAALNEMPATEIAERTKLKSYADSRGGRSASTVRGYRQNADRLAGLPSSHPVKRVLRRWARSQEIGHFAPAEAVEADDAEPRPIDMGALMNAYRLARSIASQNGFVFVDRSGEPVAIEDNERIDYDEIGRHDRPIGDTKAACLLTKPSGQIYEYRIDLDMGTLEAVNDGLPPEGY